MSSQVSIATGHLGRSPVHARLLPPYLSCTKVTRRLARLRLNDAVN
jgi:hypothetical protein